MIKTYKLPIYKIGIVVTNPIAERKKDEIINCFTSSNFFNSQRHFIYKDIAFVSFELFER